MTRELNSIPKNPSVLAMKMLLSPPHLLNLILSQTNLYCLGGRKVHSAALAWAVSHQVQHIVSPKICQLGMFTLKELFHMLPDWSIHDLIHVSQSLELYTTKNELCFRQLQTWTRRWGSQNGMQTVSNEPNCITSVQHNLTGYSGEKRS